MIDRALARGAASAARGMLAALLLPAGGAWGQRATDTALQRFTQTPFYAGLVNRALAKLPPELFHKCPTLRSTASRVTELSPVVFAADGFPNSGAWKQAFPVSGCGNDTVLNFYFASTSDEKVNTVMGIAGDTRADLRLQQDAQTYAEAGAALLAKSCQAFVTTNSAYDGADPAPANAQPAAQQAWEETWTLQGCGRRFAVNMRFIHDASGTQIVQHGGTELH